MNEDSSVELVRGKADANNPVAPNTPLGAIRLAEVYQAWVINPDVKNLVRSIQEQIDEIYKLLQELRR